MSRARHGAAARALRALLERLHALRFALARDARPALEGGLPVRRFPAPRALPYGAAERRALDRAIAEQCTSYSDGDALARFETALAAAWEVPHAVATSSGTSALACALRAAGVGPEDEVVVPAITHAATALAVLHVGARPVFADVDADAWTLGAREVEPVLTPRTRAVLPVHLGGVPCAMDGLLELARARGLVVIEDAAQAHGARWRGRPAGSVGDLGCTSFQSAKALTTGEGGAVFARDPELARRARLAHDLGERTPDGVPTGAVERFDGARELDYEFAGWNHRMGALAAALGLAQLGRLDDVRAAYGANTGALERGLADVPGLAPQRVPDGGEACGTLRFFALDPERCAATRDELAAALAAERIDVRKAYARPLPCHALFGGARDARERWPNAARVCERGLGLRVDRGLAPRDVERAVLAVRRYLAWRRGGRS